MARASSPAARRTGRRRIRWALGAFALSAAAVAGVLLSGADAAFGAGAEGARLQRMQASPEWHDDHFENPEPMWNDMRSALLRMFEATPNDVPQTPVPVLNSDGALLAQPPASGLRVTWFGHSSTLVEIDGVTVLTDPIWSERPSPIGWAGPKRWFDAPIALQNLPKIDAVVISHDHYDHLDRPTIMALRDAQTVFIVPLGVGAHLAHWGIPETRIVELDWWQSTQVGAIEVVATPARHASGRVLPQSDKTLWAGYALIGTGHRAYYSGDTGLFPAMAEIGERYGPFDVTLIEAGQYDADWPDWHLGPEQAVEAHRLVRGKLMIPVHWALFKLAHHGWTEPAERVLAAAHCREVEVLVPQPGRSVEPTVAVASDRWWPALAWRTAEERPVVATLRGDAGERFQLATCATSVAARAL